jgi:predicted DNA-binding transcriptional regulator YafY
MRADRLLAIVLLLQARGKTRAQALADELEVSRRTILRDVDALSAAGIPIYADGGHGGGIALDENYRTTLTGLHEAEVRSLFISTNTKLLGEIGLGEAAERTLMKLFAALPTRYQPSVDHIRQRIHIDPMWWWHDSQPMPFWNELQRAVYEDRPIRVVYERYDSEVVERELEPYSLVNKSSFWYLLAKRDGELRTYRVSRFQNVTVLDAHFQRDEDFDLASHWQVHLEAFRDNLSEYTFTLRVHPDRLNFVQWLLPGRCEILEAPVDGWITIRLHLESMDLAKMMVFGLGARGEVLEPQELREAVLSTARELLNSSASSAE